MCPVRSVTYVTGRTGLPIPPQNYSFTTVATKDQSDLRFGFMSDDGWVYLDNVSVTATPAPGAIALLGAAGLVGARRRRA